MENEPTNSGSAEKNTLKKEKNQVFVMQPLNHWIKGALDQFHAYDYVTNFTINIIVIKPYLRNPT